MDHPIHNSKIEDALINAHVDLEAICKNIQSLKKLIKNNAKFMAVVKANGYGHGAVRVAQKAVQSGAGWLGVSRLHEAVELRKAGIIEPILVFGYVYEDQIPIALKYDIILSVYGFQMAEKFSQKASQLNKEIRVHLKVDTGMGRVGMIVAKDKLDTQIEISVIQRIGKIAALPGIELNGLYTHFAASDSKDKTYTHQQIKLFKQLLDDLEKQNISIGVVHAANSAGIIDHEEAHFDMVRAGISMYGFYPSNEVDSKKIDLFPAMTLKTVVTAVRTVPKGFCVSYGMTHKTDKETQLVSVPVGYADGYSRLFSSNASMLIKGQRVPVVGRVCMDQTMIDVGNIPDIAPGDEVVVFGKQEGESLHADELASKIGTINYEIVSALTARVSHIYLDSETDSEADSG